MHTNASAMSDDVRERATGFTTTSGLGSKHNGMYANPVDGYRSL